MPTSTTFADILPVVQLASHVYEFTFSEDWCTGTVPSGGYVASALLIAARNHMQRTHSKYGQNDVINCHIEYLRRTSTGPVTVTVQDVKLGARTSNLFLVLSQPSNSLPRPGTQVKVHASVIMSSISSEEGTTHQTKYKLSPPQLPVDPVTLNCNKDKNYVLRRPDAFAEYRRAAGNVKMFFVRPERRSEDYVPSIVDLWAFLTPRDHTLPGYWTNDALGFLVDIFTAINERYVNAEVEDALLTENITEGELARLMKNGKLGGGPAKFWYPTLAMNLDVKKLLPQPGSVKDGGVVMLFVRVQAKKILNGRMDLSVEVWDEAGDLVALSSHANLIMDAARNTARTQPEKTSKI